MPGLGPDPAHATPLPAAPGVAFLKPLAEGRANVEIGDYTYFDSPGEPERFFEDNILYHFDFIGDRLIIGKFCAIAMDVRFMMNGGTHVMRGFSTFPFNIFGGGWEDGFDPESWSEVRRGDTVIGHDVWIARDATILPGVTIGSGAIIGAGAWITKDVPPYTVVAGNPAKVVKKRFDPATVEALLSIAWWNWPIEKISRNLNAIRGADLAALEAAR